MTGLSDSLAAWMREIRLERAALIGNSFGYQIIADLAVRHPERFEWTVLQGPAMDPGREPIWNRCGDSCSTCPTNLSLLPIELLDYLSAEVQCWLPAVFTLLGE